ncbi:MAG TPA: IS1182 family transposase [Candidatus Tectomicrobia bacterium]
MSLHPQPVPPVPEETARVARAAFPHGNLYLVMRDALGALFTDEDFATLFPRRGQPAEAPWRLALILVLQYVEDLSDRQAADAVRSRIDWKYALSLELADPGFDSTVLSEFRTRLVTGAAEQRILDAILTKCREQAWLQARGRQRTDSTHVLAHVRAVNRLECVRETLRHALNRLATVAPAWLQAHCLPAWGERYGRRLDATRLSTSTEDRSAYAQEIGADGYALLSALYAPHAPVWLREEPAVETLRRVWVQQFYREDGGVRWRTEHEGIPPAGLFISSPYDIEARYAKKHTTSWVGYKVHVTETCEDDAPHVITHVETTAGPVSDGAVTPRIHEALAQTNLLPHTHIVDTGYLDAELLATSQREYGVDLLGPTRPDYKWQAQAARGFDVSHFPIDWAHHHATCPGGHTSLSWTPAVDDRMNAVVKIKFSMQDCQPCPHRVDCTRAKRRTITVRCEEHYDALQAARARETSAAYTTEYAKRAGIEGTLSEGIRAHGLRRARYIGEAKTHLQHVLTAAAINFVRISNWLMGKPLATTRTSAFQKLIEHPLRC